MSVITLQFITTDALLSQAIRFFQRSWMSHVDSVTTNGRLLGAQNVGGVQIRPPNYEKFSRVERVNITITDAIVAFALDRDWRSPDAWFCDELVGTGLEHAGVMRNLAPQVNRLDVRDLYLVVSAIAPVNS